MKVHFFERNPLEGQVSIEKLFEVIKTELQKNNIEVKSFRNPFSLSKMLKALLFFKKNQGDINHITGDIHWAALMLDSSKTVLTVHDLVGLNSTTGWRKKIYKLLWVDFPFKKLKYITAISEKTRDEIIAVAPSAKNKITVIPNCITTEVLPAQFSKNNPTPKILVVGTRSNKNIERIFQALQNLNVMLTIVGDLTEEHVKMLSQYNLCFENFKNISDDKLLGLYDASDILCFPSLYEGFGLPVLEAQARNCAVVTSNISPMKEVAGDAALLVNPENISEIRNAVSKLAENQDIKQGLILRGKKNLEKYAKSIVADQYINLYEKILNSRK